MTVKELIAELSKLDPNAIVVMSSDGEGNSHSPLYSCYPAMYAPNSTWSGDIYHKEDYEQPDSIDPDLAEGRGEADDETDFWDISEDIPENAVDCVVLCPTN